MTGRAGLAAVLAGVLLLGAGRPEARLARPVAVEWLGAEALTGFGSISVLSVAAEDHGLGREVATALVEALEHSGLFAHVVDFPVAARGFLQVHGWVGEYGRGDGVSRLLFGANRLELELSLSDARGGELARAMVRATGSGRLIEMAAAGLVEELARRLAPGD